MKENMEMEYDGALAARLAGGAAAAYGEEAAMRAWARSVGGKVCGVVRDAGTDTAGFVAAWPEGAVVVFRGTADLRNWMTDLDWELTTDCTDNTDGTKGTEGTYGTKGKVHRGFLRALDSVWGTVAELVEGVKAERVWFTGHSLGGALAMLAAARWASARLSPGENIGGSLPRAATQIYTFGQPRVGNGAWAAWYDGMLRERTFRVVHGEDVVARVPWLMGIYRHAGREVFYDCHGVARVDAPWWRKAGSDVLGLWREWRDGRLALLADHGVSTYVGLLEGSWS